MNLAEHLKIRTPIVWINTSEPDRLTQQIVENCPKDVYRLDALKGLVVYRNNSWKQVLIEMFDPSSETFEENITNDFNVSLQKVMDEKATFVIYFADKIVEELLPFLATSTSNYRNSFFSNTSEDIPVQIIFLSCNSEIPPELGHNIAYVEAPLPSEVELAEIAAHIHMKSNISGPEDIDLSKISRAGLGLNETEFIQSCLLSVSNHNKLVPSYISSYKLEKIKNAGLLEIRQPKIGLHNIGGMDLAKDLINHVVWSWDNPEVGKEFGVEPLRRVLMVGVPGSGKSAICEAAALTLGLELAKFGVSQMMDKFIGESERKMRSAFEQIKAMAPLVVWMDELGRDLSQGDYQGDGGTTSRVHGEFLTGIQELPNNVFLMAAANRIDSIAPEMLRADRFDKIMFVGFPTMEERMDIFSIHLGERAQFHDLQKLAENSSTYTGAEIKSVIKETKFKVTNTDMRHITDEDIMVLLPTQQNRIWIKHRASVLDMYKRAVEEWDWASSGQKSEAESVLNQTIGQKFLQSAGRSITQGF